MLDTETKRRIDTARDILVGKVPDPKSQVEQITIALIYKFMDDMDAESEELGGKRKFFAGEFARYGWAKLMRSGLGGHETLNLYSESIAKMPENPGIPKLFRDIFKNAYLPYRDPETLRAFLKIIDNFEYDHSERLGDAFEYLLSVLGSQGDAGQFRTPRHIIDFMVKIVDPKKTESVLDPACGTAGFLISSYKHIMQANTDENDNSTLTPDEKGKLASNFTGYDISPDMVRLSLVNMYLHGFAAPMIHEYDTLTSLDRWNEYADVILANPPFMSPKGGIIPHKRFSMQCKRSEVLFVDYMSEHLTPSGRAGIIVPEGVIFQGGTAYKQLRKMLVEEYLVAVVSLPAGVFNPYSGVKTSILILDKSLAKRTGFIGFFKVENDGFNLGAQRRSIDKNDLPQVQEEIVMYLDRVRSGQPVETEEPAHGLIVAKQKIAAIGEYNLSGERYRENGSPVSNYPQVPIGEICELFNGRAFKPEDWENEESGGVPIVRIQNLNNPNSSFNYYTGDISEKNTINNGELLFSWSGSRGTSFGAHIWKGQRAVLNQHIFKVEYDVSRAIKMYLLHALNKAVVEVEANLHGGVGLVHITKGDLERIQIPLPPLEVQKEIVAEIEGYQKVIDGARAVVENYKPHIHVDPEWPMVELGEVCVLIQYGLSVPLDKGGRGYKTFRMSELDDGRCVDNGRMKYADISRSQFEKYRLLRGDILFNRTNSFELVGRTGLFDMEGDYCFASYLIRLVIERETANPFFVSLFMNSDCFQKGIKQFASRAIGQSNINAKNLASYPIPHPPLEVQQEIVSEIEAEQALVSTNRELITRMEKKIQGVLDRVWGEKA